MQRRMGVDDRLTPIEFFQERVERCMAEIIVAVAREQTDTFELENIERIGDFRERVLDTVHGNDRKGTKTLGPTHAQIRRVFIEPSGQRVRLGWLRKQNA